MNARPIQAADEPRWQTYVDQHPDGTLFHGLRWRDQVREHGGGDPSYLLVERDGRVRGVLPLFRAKTLGGRALVSVPWAVYGGVLADDPEAEESLLAAARAASAEFGARHVELRYLHAPRAADLPTSALYVTFRRELPDDPAACLEMIPRKSRAAARQARDKHGLEFAEDPAAVGVFHDLFVANKRALGSPVFSRRYFESLQARFGAQVRLHVARHEGAVIAACFSFVDRDVWNPYYSGSAPGTERLGSMNFLYWKLMETAAAEGLRRFDFGRSRAGTGPCRFKEHMGFVAQPLPYQYLLPPGGEIPSINPSNPKFDRAKQVWSRLPTALVKAVGPRLMRYFP